MTQHASSQQPYNNTNVVYYIHLSIWLAYYTGLVGNATCAVS